jgi:hypothetical protein
MVAKSLVFFSKNAGDLRFFILRRRKKKDKNPCTNQHKISSVHMVTESTNPKPSTVPPSGARENRF